MDEQLKPCPFCGAAPSLPNTTGGGDERNGYNFCVSISCGGCGATVTRNSHKRPSGWCDDTGQAKREAIDAWNRRA